jgi:acetoin utilization deacetylase AcuC-like enzyme
MCNTLSIPINMMRRIGFPQDESIIHREKLIMQGTINSTLFAFKDRVGFNIAGGTHHAFAAKGEGFCIFNDIAIAAMYLINNHLAKKILVIDLDVHQGNGTASIFKNEERVFTFSMHGKDNYPLEKEKSNLDVELLHNTNGDEYLLLLSNSLDYIFSNFTPDFAFFQAGVDILSTDKFGKLNVSQESCMLRDKIVFQECNKRSIPVSVTMGGGYSKDLNDILNAHLNTFKVAKEIYENSN